MKECRLIILGNCSHWKDLSIVCVGFNVIKLIVSGEILFQGLDLPLLLGCDWLQMPPSLKRCYYEKMYLAFHLSDFAFSGKTSGKVKLGVKAHRARALLALDASEGFLRHLIF